MKNEIQTKIQTNQSNIANDKMFHRVGEMKKSSAGGRPACRKCLSRSFTFVKEVLGPVTPADGLLQQTPVYTEAEVEQQVTVAAENPKGHF